MLLGKARRVLGRKLVYFFSLRSPRLPSLYSSSALFLSPSLFLYIPLARFEGAKKKGERAESLSTITEFCGRERYAGKDVDDEDDGGKRRETSRRASYDHYKQYYKYSEQEASSKNREATERSRFSREVKARSFPAEPMNNEGEQLVSINAYFLQRE